MPELFAGIEGGATHSTIVIMNESGLILAKDTGPGTNHFLLGIDECTKRIAEMVNKAKATLNISTQTPIKALGLALSGCEKEATNQELVNKLKLNHPQLSELYAVGSDTDGSINATSNSGGIACIAGTGSNTLLINPNGDKVQCGGYGYMLGDEGGAWKIAHSGIKYCIDDMDGFEKSPYPIDWLWNVIKAHFQIETTLDLLSSMYTHFDKAFMAALCKKFALGANNDGDELAKHIFVQAGSHLAKAISAVVPKADKSLTKREGGVHILCVGSVWLSWSLLEPGFVGYLRTNDAIKELSLMKIKTTIAVGAAYMASDRLKLNLARDYNKNYEVFYHYSSQNH